MLTEIVSAAILLIFTGLLAIAVVSTGARWIRYHRTGYRRPRLLNRDVILVLGFALSLGSIAVVRAFDLSHLISNDDGPFLWWLLWTGIPPIISVAVYDYYELRVIERDQQDAPPSD